MLPYQTRYFNESQANVLPRLTRTLTGIKPAKWRLDGFSRDGLRYIK